MFKILLVQGVAGFQLAGQSYFDGRPLILLLGGAGLARFFVNPALVGEQASQVKMGAGVLGVEFVGGLQIVLSLLVLLLVVMDDAQIAPQDRTVGLVLVFKVLRITSSRRAMVC